MDSDTKFDIKKEKKFLPINICNTPGTKLRDLRLKNNMTLKKLANKININAATLMHLEQDKINMPYHYWKAICDCFCINHIEYLELDALKEETIQDKLLKIRAYIGGVKWKDVGDYLGYSKAFTIDLLTRYKPNKNQIRRINTALKELKKL